MGSVERYSTVKALLGVLLAVNASFMAVRISLLPGSVCYDALSFKGITGSDGKTMGYC